MLWSVGTEEVRKEIEVLDGVGHWHCVEAGEVIGGRIVRFAMAIDS